MSVIVFIPFICVFAFSIYLQINGAVQTRKLAYQYIKETAQLYLDKISSDMQMMDSDIIQSADVNQEVYDFPPDMDDTQSEYYDVLNSLMKQNRSLKDKYSETGIFYVYNRRSKTFVDCDGNYFETSSAEILVRDIKKTIDASADCNDETVNWKVFSSDSNISLLSTYSRNGVVFGCTIPVETIFKSLEQMNLTYDLYPFLYSSEGMIIRPKVGSEHDVNKMIEMINESSSDNRLDLDNYCTCSFPFGNIGTVRMLIISSDGMLERVLFNQRMSVAIICVFILVMLLTAGIYYMRILQPMKRFVDGLDEIDEDQYINEDGENGIIELETASIRFKKLLRKIQSLKIAIYEKELEKSRIELDYVEEQIKPHFYINCLSIIHGIAESDNEGKIVQITSVLSEYIRYMFDNDSQKKNLGAEISHIQNYVDIQHIRYGDESFSFEVINDEGLEKCLVPSLLLQTIVENSFSHGMSLDKHLDITLYIVIEEGADSNKNIYISLSDTGPGFPEDVLRRLNDNEEIYYEGRKHVGLNNIQKRLKLMYGDKASIVFSNMSENYGAIVEVRFPLEYD